MPIRLCCLHVCSLVPPVPLTIGLVLNSIHVYISTQVKLWIHVTTNPLYYIQCFVMISNTNPIGKPYLGSASNAITLMEHLLEPVCCSFAVHWMFAILHLVLALIGFGIPLWRFGFDTFLPSCTCFAHIVLLHSVLVSMYPSLCFLSLL